MPRRRFLHALWLPLAYLINPLWLGQQLLRAILNRNGVDAPEVSLDVSRALAARSLEFVKIKSDILKWSPFRELAEYTEELEFAAEQVRALLYLQDRTDPFLRSCQPVLALLQSQGVAVPPLRLTQLAERSNAIAG